jgi:hypothetical protein
MKSFHPDGSKIKVPTAASIPCDAAFPLVSIVNTNLN